MVWVGEHKPDSLTYLVGRGRMSKPGADPSSGIGSEDVLIPSERHPARWRRESRQKRHWRSGPVLKWSGHGSTALGLSCRHLKNLHKNGHLEHAHCTPPGQPNKHSRLPLQHVLATGSI